MSAGGGTALAGHTPRPDRDSVNAGILSCRPVEAYVGSFGKCVVAFCLTPAPKKILSCECVHLLAKEPVSVILSSCWIPERSETRE